MPEVISGPEIRQESKAKRAHVLVKLLDRLVEVGVAVVLIATVYVLYSLTTGDFIAYPKSPGGDQLTAQTQLRLLHNAHLAAGVILIGSSLTSALAILRWGWVAAPAYLAGVWGVLLYFLAPWGLAVSLVGKPDNDIANLLGWTFLRTGQVVLVMATVRIVVGVVHKFATAPRRSRAPVELTVDEREEEHKSRRHRSLLPKCWELSFCRPEMRDYCPAYREGKSCWRRGTGCLCDPVFAQRAMETAEKEQGIRIAPQEREARERMRRQIQVDMSGKARRARCRTCPIYNEHQHYKYRAFAWLAYPATAAVVWLLMPYIHQGYVMFATLLHRLVSGAAFLPNREPDFAPFISIVLETKGIEFLVVLAVAFVVVSYLLQLVEYFVFEVKV